MQFGEYELFDRIAVGGMAEVYRARIVQEGVERHVAIKRILPHLCTEEKFIEMFVKEARLTAALRHDNIARVFDFGVLDGSFYLAMELIEGRDLRWILETLAEQRCVMPIPVAVHIIFAVCEALAYAHSARDDRGVFLGVVHRDVSPPNIIISRTGEVKLIDFGIAKVRHFARETTHGRLKGKCAYMAPEQIRSQAVDSRADIFGIGAMFHELLTGSALFLGPSQISTLQMALRGEIKPPSEKNPKVPRELDEIALKALSRDVGRRYQKAEEMIADLQRFCTAARCALVPAELARWMEQQFELGAQQGASWKGEAGITAKQQALKRLRSALRRSLAERTAREPADGPAASDAHAPPLLPQSTLLGPGAPPSPDQLSRIAQVVQRGSTRDQGQIPAKNLHPLSAASPALPLPHDAPDEESDGGWDDDAVTTAARDQRRSETGLSGETTTVRVDQDAEESSDVTTGCQDETPTVDATPGMLAAARAAGEQHDGQTEVVDDGPTAVDEFPAGARALAAHSDTAAASFADTVRARGSLSPSPPQSATVPRRHGASGDSEAEPPALEPSALSSEKILDELTFEGPSEDATPARSVASRGAEPEPPTLESPMLTTEGILDEATMDPPPESAAPAHPALDAATHPVPRPARGAAAHPAPAKPAPRLQDAQRMPPKKPRAARAPATAPHYGPGDVAPERSRSSHRWIGVLIIAAMLAASAAGLYLLHQRGKRKKKTTPTPSALQTGAKKGGLPDPPSAAGRPQPKSEFFAARKEFRQ